jgi:hypothetical protein
MTPTPLTPQEYIAIVRAAHHMELARLHYTALLERVGLNPMQMLRYDDATLTIVPAVDQE